MPLRPIAVDLEIIIIPAMSSRIQELLAEYTLKIEAEMKDQLVALINGLDISEGGGRHGFGSRGKGEKRTADELEALSAKFLAFVEGHPDMRIEQINRELGTSTKDLALPIRKLLGEKKIKAKGRRRGTTYAITAKGAAKE
jgi:hypothetical protein